MQGIKKKRAVAVSTALALVLALSACDTDIDNGDTDDLGATTTLVDPLAPTTTLAP